MVYDELVARGFVKDVSDEEGLRRALDQSTTFYCGYDPTATSFHVGNLVGIMLLMHLQRGGHRPIAIVGGGTGMIGDPSGKTTERALMTSEAIAENLAGLRGQLSRFLDFSDGGALLLNNADWLLQLGYIGFLRDIGRYFTVNQLLQHETYRERLTGDGLSFIEFNYALVQAYDFLHLYREYGCVLQIGGADQWFNIMAGRELVRRAEGKSVYGLVTPLITTASGAKMGKTATGAVWLDPTRTSPYDYYQFWVNTEDLDVGRFLKLFTFLPLDEIDRLSTLKGAELREAKRVLAFEATAICHGVEAATGARNAAQALFSGDATAAMDAVPTLSLPSADLDAGIPADTMLVRLGLMPSRGEARKLILNGGVTVNDARLEEPHRPIDSGWLVDGSILLRLGKKKFCRVVPAP